MNVMTMRKRFQNKEPIVIGHSKKPVEDLTKAFTYRKEIMFSNRIPFIETYKHYQRINEEDALAAIRLLLNPDDRLRISTSQIAESYRRLMYMPELQINIFEKFWEQQHLLNLLNGVYDIHTMKPTSNWRDCCFDYLLNFSYTPNSKLEDAPVFKNFVETSLGLENLECLLRSLAYCISSLTKGRKCIVLLGYGQTGKSTLLNLLESIIPTELVSHEPFHTMASPQSKAKYPNKRVNISRDNSNYPNRHEDSFKSLISCEMTTGREVYEKSIDFIPTLKFIFATNCDLNFAHPDDAVYDRIVVIPFSKKVPESMRDPDLDEKLTIEKDTIFSLAVDRLKDLLRSNYDFCMSDEAQEYLNHRRMLLHTAEIFLKEKTVLDPHGTISSVTLYDAYKDWCSSNGLPPIGRNEFYHKVKHYSSDIQYKKVDSESGRVNGFHGLRLHDST